jgi:hypothetical protein
LCVRFVRLSEGVCVSLSRTHQAIALERSQDQKEKARQRQ